MYIITSKKSKRFVPHYNHAFGKRIYTKEDYLKEMKKGNYLPYDEACKIADKRRKDLHKPYDKPSDKAMELIHETKSKIPDKNGKIKFSDRQIEALKDIGVVKPTSKYIPKDLPLEGGIREEREKEKETKGEKGEKGE